MPLLYKLDYNTFCLWLFIYRHWIAYTFIYHLWLGQECAYALALRWRSEDTTCHGPSSLSAILPAQMWFGLVWAFFLFFCFVLSFKKKLSRVPWLTWKILENQEKYLRTNKDSTLTLGTNSAECDQFYSTLTAPRVHILNTGESAIARVAIQFLSCH